MLENPENLPNNIPDALEDVALLQQADGKPIIHHYSLDGITPYATRLRCSTSRLGGAGGRWVVSASATVLLLFATATFAAERELEDAPPPNDVGNLESPLERAFLRPARKEPLIPGVRERLQELPAFFADTEFDVRFRTHYLRKDRAIDELSEAWAMGGSLYYRSGWLADLLSLEAEFFTSQPIVAPLDRDGTLLLQREQRGYAVVGVANAKLRYKGLVLTGYRQTLGLPYVNRNDSRMTPNTFEAVTLAKDEGKIRFSTGYVFRIKRRNSEEFISMAEAALVPEDRGLGYASVLFKPNDDSHVGASFGIVPDVLTGLYGEASWNRTLSDAWALRLEAQGTYQQSVGDDLIPGSPFATWNVGARASSSLAGAVLRLGFSVTGDQNAILSPYGSSPSYVDLMQRTFNGANEKAVLASLSYDFSRVGLTGLSAIVNFVAAWDGQLTGFRGDAREVDATIDYRLPKRLRVFEGLWLRLRGSWLEDDELDRNGTDFRVILRYDFPVV